MSEIFGSIGIICIITANPLMGISVIICTAYSYVVKKEKIDNKKAIKGAGYSAVSCIIFAALGLPILVELIIVMVVFRIIKGKSIPGRDLYKRIATLWREKTSRDISGILPQP